MIDIIMENKEYKVIAQTTYYLIKKANDKHLIASSDKDEPIRGFKVLTKAKKLSKQSDCKADCYWNGRGHPLVCKNRCGDKFGSNPTQKPKTKVDE
jgi:hypothetical protein